MFVPVECIAEYVEQEDGKPDLALSVNTGEDATSEDVDSRLVEVWKGMWITIMKEVSPGSAEELIEGDKREVSGLLKILRGKAGQVDQGTNGQ